MKGRIQTVLGLIEPEQLGLTLTHEHLIHDLPKKLFQKPLPLQLQHLQNCTITIENLGCIREYPQCTDANHEFSEEAVGEAIKEEMIFFKKCGGGTIVDNGSIGVRAKHQHTFLEKLSKESGVNIILGTGFYVERSQSQGTLNMTIEEMEKIMREEIMIGIDGTDIKCGFIGEIGCSWPLLPFEKRSLISSAMVQKETGCPIIIHPGRDVKSPEEIVRIFQEAGGSADRIIMGHLDRTFFTEADLMDFASLGTFCELDLFGNEISHYQMNEEVDMPSDAQRIALVRSLVEEGYGEKIVLSQDIHTKHRIMKYGGHGYSHILVNIVPKMLKRGLTDEDIKNFLLLNPRKCLVFQ